MDPVTLVIVGLVGFWILGFFLKIGGTLLNLLLLVALVTLAAKFFNLV